MINKKLKKYFSYGLLTNIKSYSFITFAQIIIQIFFPPIILMIWGVKNYGAWIYLLSFLSFASLILVPVTEVVRLEMTKAYANKKYNYVNDIFFNSLIWNGLNIIIISGSLIILKNSINFSSSLFSEINNININFLFLILFLNAYFDIFRGFFYPALTFQGKVELMINIDISYEVISKLVIIISAILFEFNYVFFFYFLSNVLRFIIVIYFYYSRNFKNNFYIPKKLFNTKIIKKIFYLSTSYFCERIAFNIKNDGFLFLVGTYFNATTLSLLSTMKTIFYFFPMRISSILNFSSYIDFSKLKFNSYKEIPSKQKIYLKLILFFLFFFIAGSVLLGKLFYEFWIRNNEMIFDYKIMLFLITETSIIILFNTIIAPFKSLNKFFNITAIDLLNSLIAIILCFSLLNTNPNLYHLFFITVGMCLLNLIITISLYKNYLNNINEK